MTNIELTEQQIKRMIKKHLELGDDDVDAMERADELITLLYDRIGEEAAGSWLEKLD